MIRRALFEEKYSVRCTGKRAGDMTTMMPCALLVEEWEVGRSYSGIRILPVLMRKARLAVQELE